MIKPLIAGLLAAALLTGCATLYRSASAGGHDYPEATAYDVSDDAMGDVNAALARAGEKGTRVLLVMGANWCHDSRALAGWLETDRFQTLIEERYELVYVNVGMPQRGDGHNLGIARRFGVEELPGTPNLLVVTTDGDLVNSDTATTWRDAASREEDAIFEELSDLSQSKVSLDAKAKTEVKEIWVSGAEKKCLFAASENGPWAGSIDQIGSVGESTEVAGYDSSTPWRCVAEAVFTIQEAGGSASFISNPANP